MSKRIYLRFSEAGEGMHGLNVLVEYTTTNPRKGNVRWQMVGAETGLRELLRRVGLVCVSRRKFKGSQRVRLARGKLVVGFLSDILRGTAEGVRFWLCEEIVREIFGALPQVLYWRKEKP